MLHRITEYDDLDKEKLTDIYRQTLIQYSDRHYPDVTDREFAFEVQKWDYLDYIQYNFLLFKDCEYWIFEDNNVWISALRLHKVIENIYFIEDLETHPDFRCKGYAKKLLDEVINYLKGFGSFKLCGNISKDNEASINVFLKYGFKIVSDEGFDYAGNKKSNENYGMEYEFSM